MNCNEIEHHLADYLGNELDSELRATIDSHLESCAPCRAEVESLRGTLGQLETLTTVTPAEAAASTANLEIRRLPAPWFRFTTAALRYAAVLILGVLIGHYLISGTAGAPQTQPVGPAVVETPSEPPAPRNLHPDWLAAARELAYNGPEDAGLATQLTLLRHSTRTPR